MVIPDETANILLGLILTAIGSAITYSIGKSLSLGKKVTMNTQELAQMKSEFIDIFTKQDESSKSQIGLDRTINSFIDKFGMFKDTLDCNLKKLDDFFEKVRDLGAKLDMHAKDGERDTEILREVKNKIDTLVDNQNNLSARVAVIETRLKIGHINE